MKLRPRKARGKSGAAQLTSCAAAQPQAHQTESAAYRGEGSAVRERSLSSATIAGADRTGSQGAECRVASVPIRTGHTGQQNALSS